MGILKLNPISLVILDWERNNSVRENVVGITKNEVIIKDTHGIRRRSRSWSHIPSLIEVRSETKSPFYVEGIIRGAENGFLNIVPIGSNGYFENEIKLEILYWTMKYIDIKPDTHNKSVFTYVAPISTPKELKKDTDHKYNLDKGI